jgi:hypothetical protein
LDSDGSSFMLAPSALATYFFALSCWRKGKRKNATPEF